ncbi:MAG: DNA-binding response regulator [Peptostreptococcaceae bacterium]|nr:DNA-binding response regulator [uncultured Romboutsia sp.]MDU4935074.1 DNA-binding response regulator [Peptostreptococcaceae bacterium]
MQSNSLAIIEEIDIDVDECRKHLERLHNDSKGYITIASKDPLYKQWHYKIQDILENPEIILNKINTYVSQNTFYKPQRRIENIKELRAIYIDIDCHKTRYSKEAVQYFLENDLYGHKIPRPNFLIDSGRGLYYVLLIEPVPSMAMPLWYAVQRYIYNVLKEYGADVCALDPTRVLRVVGTINSKSNSFVEILDMHNYEYTLREIQHEYLPEISEKREKKKGRPKKIVSLFTEYSLYHARILDITKVCELRDYDVKGHREVILFLYRYFTCCFIQDSDEALQKALELNSMFKEPLPEREVITDTKSAEKAYIDKKYKYTNAKLIKILDITLEEQQHLKTIISGKEKYRRSAEEQKAKKKASRRNENGLTKKQQELEDLKIKINKLKNKGNSVREIAKILGISKSKVGRLI